MGTSEPERFESLSRTSGCWAVVSLAFGVVVLTLTAALFGFGTNLRAAFGPGAVVLLLGLAFGIFLVRGGIKMMKHRGAVEYVLRGDSEGFQWGKTGTEFSVRFADIAEIEYDSMLADSSQTTIRMKDGRYLVIPAYFHDHTGAFRYMRRHFRGPMTWRAKKIESPDAWLY